MAAFSAAGAAWLATEILFAVWPDASKEVSSNATAYLTGLALLCLAAFIYRSYEPLSIRIKIPTTPNFLRIKYGDIFDERDCGIIVPVNEFFDYEIGQYVSPTSIHGGFINSVYNGDVGAFRKDVDDRLEASLGVPTERDGGRYLRYPLGTVIRLPMGSKLALLVATANTDLQTSKASTSVDKLWLALESVYRSVRDYGGGQCFAMPLVGNGRSNLNLPPQNILRLLVLSIVTFARREGLASDLIIVLPRACLEHLDLLEIKRDWGAHGI